MKNKRINAVVKYLYEHHGASRITTVKALGVTDRTLNAWLNFENTPQVKQYDKIANAFGVDPQIFTIDLSPMIDQEGNIIDENLLKSAIGRPNDYDVRKLRKRVRDLEFKVSALKQRLDTYDNFTKKYADKVWMIDDYEATKERMRRMLFNHKVKEKILHEQARRIESRH